jgi:hypothetical protein
MFGDDYCLVSKELLLFLRWVCNNDPALVNDFVKKAWGSGFKNFINSRKNHNKISLSDLNISAVDFFGVVENIINTLIENDSKNSTECLSDNFDNDGIVGCLSGSNYTKEKKKDIDYSKKQHKLKDNSFNNADQNSILGDKDSVLKNFLKNWDHKNKTVH